MLATWWLQPSAAITLGSNRTPSNWLIEGEKACEAAVFSPQAYRLQMQILFYHKLQARARATFKQALPLYVPLRLQTEPGPA